MSRRSMLAPGPFVADQLRSGDPYELSHGHPVHCAPTGRRGSTRNLVGGSALETDPKVISAGVDLGVSVEPGMLRAPDVAVGDFEDAAGWATKAPPLAVEYADVSQDEEELAAKVVELLAAGTRHLWVVRLGGAPRVEVHEPNKRMRVVGAGGVLSAPDVLQNPVPVAVLYDRDAAHEATLRNLLQRKGYAGLEAVEQKGREAGLEKGLEEGREEGLQEGHQAGRIEALRASILAVLAARGIDAAPIAAKVATERDTALLDGWLRRAATVDEARAVLASRRAQARRK